MLKKLFAGLLCALPFCACSVEEDLNIDAPYYLDVSQSGNSIHLSWGSVDGAEYYTVYHTDDASESWSKIKRLSETEVSFREDEFGAGLLHYFSVTASNAEMESDFSESVCVAIEGDDQSDNGSNGNEDNSEGDSMQVPGTPTGLSGTYSDGAVHLTWDSVEGATGYHVYYSLDLEEWYNDTIETNSYSYETSYPEYYYFAVSAVNNAGESEISEIFTLNQDGGDEGSSGDDSMQVPGTPTGLSGTYSDGALHLTWDSVEGATGYHVYYSLDLEEWNYDTVETNSCSYETSYPEYYYFAVSAVNNAGESEMSEIFTLNQDGGGSGDSGNDNDGDENIGQAPAPPSVVKGSRSGSYVIVTWAAVNEATSYNVYYSFDTKEWERLTSTTSTTYSFKCDSQISVAVKAVNAYGEGTWSKYVTVAANNGSGGGSGGDNGGGNGSGGDSGSGGGNNGGGSDDDYGTTEKPSVPTGVSAEFSGSVAVPKIEISWDVVSGAEYYKVYRSTSASGSYTFLKEAYGSYCYDTAPKEGKNYYKVTAVNSAGESGKSSYAYAEYDPYAAKPGTPQWGNCSVSGMNMTLRWSIPKGKGIGVPDKIIIIARAYHGETVTVEEISGTSTSYTFNVFDYLWYNDGNGCNLVYVSILAENEYGPSEPALQKVYNYTEQKWIN